MDYSYTLGSTTVPYAIVSMSDYSFIVGEAATVVFTFNVVPFGFIIDHIVAENGVISDLVRSEDFKVYTATFTPTAGIDDSVNYITVLGRDGQYTSGGIPSNANSSSPNYAVHTVTNTVSVGMDDYSMFTGDTSTVTFTFGTTPIGFSLDQVTSPNGTMNNLAVDGVDNKVYTAIFTPTAEIDDDINIITVEYADSFGNPTVTGTSSNYTVHTVTPSVVITMDDYYITVGETPTITFTFNTTPLFSGIAFAVGDIDAQNGEVSNLTVDAIDSTIYTATFTPDVGIEDDLNIITVAGSAGEYTGAYGNSSSSDSTSPNYIIDIPVGAGDVAPDAPTLFSATDAENCQITCTWTDSTTGTPAPKYDIYEVGNATPLAVDVTSPSILSQVYDTSTYYVKSYNYVGGVDSNTDSGTGIDTRPIAFTLAGTTDEIGQITFTWLEGGTTYELYKNSVLAESAITSPYVYTVNPDESDMYFVRATNSCGYTDSDTINAYSTEVPTLPNIIVSGDYMYLTVLTTATDTFTRSNWHILVDGVEDTSGSVYKLSGAGNTLRIGQFQYIYSGETVTVSHDVQEGTIAAFTATAVTNNSTLTNGVSIPPIYEMVEPLNQVGTYYYLDNSASSGEVYDGRLEHSSQSTDEIEGDPWLPTNAQYKQLGWIDLDVNGSATRQIRTGWIPPSDSEWTVSAIYDVVLDVSYSAYTLHYYYDGADWVLDIYLWSSIADVPTTPTHTGVTYTPPTTEWIIKETPPEIITLSGITYEMDSFTTV